MRECNNLPQPNPYILVFGSCGRLLHALTPPRSAFLYLQFLARCHPYILLHFYTCKMWVKSEKKMWGKMSGTSVKIIKNEVGCRDDTVPKTVETIESMHNLPQPPPYIFGFWGLRKIVACPHSSSQCLLVSTVFGTVSSLHPTSFLYLYVLCL